MDTQRIMISFEEGLQRVLSSVPDSFTERIPLEQAFNRIVAEDIVSDINMPPFNKSAMDGYACRKEDLKYDLEIVEEIYAGMIPTKSIEEKQCARIMTGAMVPSGADIVLMKEHAQIISNNKVRCIKQSNKNNICYVGEDAQKGDLVIRKGERLTAAHIAVLASVGAFKVPVFQRPRISIMSTGNELVEPFEKPNQVQIRNSNSYQLMAQLKSMYISADYSGIIKDNEDAIKNVLTEQLPKYDVIIISGGVSVGDLDLVPEVLKQLGADILIHGMKVKPGKHLLFAKLEHSFIIGLPGNPVSSFVQFEVLVKPFLLKWMSCSSHDTSCCLPLGENYVRKKSDTMFFVPIRINKDGSAEALDYHGSAHIHAYTKAMGIMEIPIGTSELKVGEKVCVRPL